MNQEQLLVQKLTAFLTSRKFKKIIVKTKHFRETFTPSKAVTIDRVLPEVGVPALSTLVNYLERWRTEDAVIEIDFTRQMEDLPFYIIWYEGIWYDGIWVGGEWKTGIWKSGLWLNGIWKDGIWKGGTWKGGVWEGGQWLGGEWQGGVFRPKSRPSPLGNQPWARR